jgi:hypothetical protein
VVRKVTLGPFLIFASPYLSVECLNNKHNK